ncbi:MAG: NADH-quinone oxidoreductase subunit A [Clostridiales bacterium]|nr:NADH-quinone oxidoreductase subunit A [Clostridiales bacterium]
MTRQRTSIRYFLIALLFVVFVASLALTACKSGYAITWKIDDHATVTVEGEKKLPQKAKDGTTLEFTIKTDNGYVVDEVLRDNKPINANSAGKYSITISADVTITVTTKLEVSGIKVVTKPSKLTYNSGERLDKTGMVVQMEYTVGNPQTITDYSIRYQTSNASSFKMGDTYFQVYVGEHFSERIMLNEPVATLITLDLVGGSVDDGYMDSLKANTALKDVTRENGVVTFKYTSELTEDIPLPASVQMNKGEVVGDYDFRNWSCADDEGKGDDEVRIVKDGVLTKETVTSAIITANWNAHLADITGVAYEVVQGVPYLVLEGTYRAATSLRTYLTEGNKKLAYMFDNEITGTRGESFELRANMLEFAKSITLESGFFGSWLDVRVAQEVNGVIEHTEAPQDKTFEKYSVKDGDESYSFAFETWEGWRKVVVTVIMPFNYTMTVDNNKDVLSLTFNGQIKENLVSNYVGATVKIDWWMGGSIGPVESKIAADGSWKIVFTLSPENGFKLNTVGYAHIKIVTDNGDVLYKDGDPNKDGDLLASGMSNRDELEQIAVPNGEIVGNGNTTMEALMVSNEEGTIVYYPGIAWWNAVVIYGHNPKAPEFKASGDVALKVDNMDKPTKVYYVVKLTVTKNAEYVYDIVFGNVDGTEDVFAIDREMSKVNGNVYTLYFDVTEYSGSQLWSNLYLTRETADGEKAYDKLTEIKNDTNSSDGLYAIVNGIKYYIKGEYNSPCLFIGTPEDGETNPPEVNPDVVEKQITVDGTFFDLVAEDGKAYVVVKITAVGFKDADEIKETIMYGDIADDFQWTTECFKVEVVDGGYKLWFDITAMEMGTDGKLWSGLYIGAKQTEVKVTPSLAHGKTITVGNVIYTVECTSSTWNIPCIITKEVGTPDYTVSDVDLVEDNGTVYLVISGTYTEGGNADKLEAALEAVAFTLTHNEQAGGQGGWGVVSNFTRVVTVDDAESTWTLKISLMDLEMSAYMAKFQGTDLKNANATDGKNFTVGDTLYTLVNKFGSGEGSEFWGCIGIRVEDADAPNFAKLTIVNATLEATQDKVYFVISGSYTDIEDDIVDRVLNKVYFDLQKRGDDWARYTDFERTVNYDSSEKTWTVKLDVTQLPAHGNPYTGHVASPAGDLKLDAEHAIDGHSVTLGTLTFTIVNKPGSTNEAENWGCVSLKVENSTAKTLTYTGATLEKQEDNVYLVLTADFANYTEDELKTITYYEGNATTGEVKNGMTLTVEKVEVTGTSVKLYFNFTEVAANGEWWWGHWTIGGVNKGDVKCTVAENEIVENGRKYVIKNNEWGNMYVVVTAA